MKQKDDNFTIDMHLSEDLKMSEADPCPFCDEKALCIVYPADLWTHEGIEAFQVGIDAPLLECRACGELIR